MKRVIIFPHLYLGRSHETNGHEQEDGYDVGSERSPVVNPEGSDKGTDQHEEDGPGAQDGSHHQHKLAKKEQHSHNYPTHDRVRKMEQLGPKSPSSSHV